MKLTIILIRPHQHKPSVHLLPMKPTDHLSENAVLSEEALWSEGAQNLHALKPPGRRNNNAQASAQTLIHLLAVHRKLIKCDEKSEGILPISAHHHTQQGDQTITCKEKNTF